MNHVDTIRAHPFCKLSLPEKLETKRLGPHQPRDFVLQKQVKNRKRSFNVAWFDQFEWLTVSLEEQKFFCFYCLLFCDTQRIDRTWSSIGYDDLNHFNRSAQNHEKSEIHLTCSVRYKTLGTVSISSQLDTAASLAVTRHNEKVDKNRHILNRIIDCIRFCGLHELPLQSHDERSTSANRGIFLDLLSLLAPLDSQLEDHISNATVSRCTSPTIQNEILDCIFQVYTEELQSIVTREDFVAIEADETTDISCQSQFVIILRFLKHNVPVECVLKFVDIKDRTAQGLATVLQEELDHLGVHHDRLIAQAYDGTAVMNGVKMGVQVLMQSVYPHAQFVHCYAHQFNIVLKRFVDHISKARLFFSNILGFSTFFSVSSKRTDALRATCTRGLPTPSETRRNFQSRLLESVHEMKVELSHCFENIINDPSDWDDKTIREASGLLHILEDEQFVYLLDFFHTIFQHVDVLYQLFQDKLTNGADTSKCIHDFIKKIQAVRENLKDEPATVGSKRRFNAQDLKITAAEVCDILITHLSTRLIENSFVSSYVILDPVKFVNYKKDFPDSHFEIILQRYPFLSSEKLKSELKVIYSNEAFAPHNCNSTFQVFTTLASTKLQSNFTETTKLLKIILTTPVFSAEPERCFSTLKRVKTFLRKSMGQDRHNALAVLSIHKEEIDNIVDFNKKVIEKFAAIKHRRADFSYKH